MNEFVQLYETTFSFAKNKLYNLRLRSKLDSKCSQTTVSSLDVLRHRYGIDCLEHLEHHKLANTMEDISTIQGLLNVSTNV